MIRKHAALVLALAVATAPLLPPDGDEAVLARGREHTRMFYEGEFEALWEDLGEAVRGAFASPDNLGRFRDQVAAQLGNEAEILDESVVTSGGQRVYLRRARFEKLDDAIQVVWVYDAEDVAVGFQIAPEPKAAPSEFLDYEPKVELRLPFAEGDEWLVFWGGREIEQNYHVSYPDQRFAYDFLMSKDGKTHVGDGARNEDYYCFDEPILAPGAGRVIAAENAVADNVPGEMNAKQPLGNHVILDHGGGEYSFLAHFRHGTVAVEVGDEVEAGVLLGHCGNSGNTSEPHLHYHLQNAPEFQKGGQGLPAPFTNYVADGEPVERGEPVKGQTIRAGER